MENLERALGQYLVYRAVLAQREPERILYLAVPHEVRVDVLEGALGQLVADVYQVQLFSFDPTAMEIVRWD
jgi:hypothetical protein